MDFPFPFNLNKGSTPEGIFEQISGLRKRIAAWDRGAALGMLAGLQLRPEFQVHQTRLDLATRLVVIEAKGAHRPSRSDLVKLINRDLARSGSALLEDPAEDFFIAPVCTVAGEFHIAEGLWEKSANFTENMIEAFSRLPDNPVKHRALDHAYAALSISQILIERVYLRRFQTGGGTPKNNIPLPSQNALNALSIHALFNWSDLDRLPFDHSLITPFIFDESQRVSVEEAIPGDSALELQPLISVGDGIVVSLPSNLATCARAILIDTAVQYGMQNSLRRHLLDVQTERVHESGIARFRSVPVQKVKDQPVRQTVFEESAGRYIHILQIVDSFSEWPEKAFGSVFPDEEVTTALVTEGAKAAQKFASERGNFREGISVIFLGGWGRGRSLSIPVLKDWDFIFVEPNDAAVIGIADDAKISDLWRLRKLEKVIEKQGFEIFGANGLLNLYALWKDTKHSLIPEHHIDFQPPALFNFPTDLLLKVRKEAANRDDRQSLPHPDGVFRTVSRLNRRDAFERSEEVYASLSEVRRGVLLGACLYADQPVWLHLLNQPEEDRSFDNYETWQAALKWLSITLPAFIEHFVACLDNPVLIDFEIQWPDQSGPQTATDDEIDASILVEMGDDPHRAKVTLLPDWQRGLHRANNYAEVSLATALLTVVVKAVGIPCSENEIRTLILATVGSDDIRWRHSFVANRPITMLKGHGLLPKFHPLSYSAFALMKCGATFRVRTRSAGSKIDGEEECFQFLMAHNEDTLKQLCDAIAKFDRQSLVTQALAMMQSAQAEERTWAMSARALRAIHSIKGDHAASFEFRNRINGVLRGCSLITEVAASNAAIEGGLAVGEMDFDELLALALLHFQGAEIVSPLRGGFLKPKLRISPTGDVLFDHSFGEATLEPIAEIKHAQDRESESDSYHSHYAEPNPSPAQPEGFLEAVEAEFNLPAEAFFSLSGTLTELAIEKKTSTWVVRLSSLAEELAQQEGFQEYDLIPALQRLLLPSRSGWLAIPAGKKERDYDLSRFDRPQSIIGRPIIGISEGDDPLVVVAPGIIERSALHNIMGARGGGLHGEFWTSKEMRRFVGGMADTLGLEFNDQVAAAVAQLGLNARASVKPSDCLNQKATDELKRLGDIDVLAITDDGKHAWMIEAKDIRFCRTLGETASRLSEYRGLQKRDGKPDNLMRHLQRVDHVRKHAADLAKRLKLSTEPKIHGLVIVDSPQPMAFLPVHSSVDARTMMLSDLSAVPWARGWPQTSSAATKRDGKNRKRRK